MSVVNAVILTISDSSAKGERSDSGGPALAEFAQSRGWRVVKTQIVPDEVKEISKQIKHWTDVDFMPLILTTGGTGIGPRDVTPEALGALFEKELPGFGERMRRVGEEFTRYAALSRSTAGVRRSSFILALPGNPKGAVQSLEAVADLVEHALELIKGRRKVHDHT